MTKQKRKTLFWLFKILSIVISCALPIWSICDRFPVWTREYGATYTAGIGIILIITVLVIIFRKTVFAFIIEHWKLNHAPPLAVWLGMLIASYILVFIGDVVKDMTSVFWMGFIGCGIGTILTYVSERFNDNKKDVKSDE